jgi:hypothetical protein
VSPAGAPAQAVTASAPGRLELSGNLDGPRLCVALDRRASCRVEATAAGLEIESKEALTKWSARDTAELVERSPASLAAQTLALLGAHPGLRVVTEWKVPAGSGIQGEAALALAVTAAVSRAVGREAEPEELVALAREAATRAGRPDEHGLHAALFGGVVLTRGSASSLEAERLGVDPGRIGESLMVVDAGESPAGGSAPEAGAVGHGAVALTGRIVEALGSGRYEEIVGLVAEECEGAAVGGARRRLVDLVRGAGGAARPLGEGRLVAVWAPPGARGPGRREAVQAALQAAGLKPLAVRVDLRGLELD